jgi:tripartite ATP-independent transporter DctP family solute receptor
MKKLIVAAALVAVWAQIPGAQAYECKKSYDWKLGFNTVENSLRGEATKALKKALEAKTDGCVTVELYPGEALGTEQEMIEAVQINALDMTMSGGGALSNVDPLFGATTLPFLFQSFEEAQAAIDGPFGKRLQERVKDKNLKILTFSELGFAQITNNARPIKTVEDIYGLKIRSPKENTLIKTFETLGASVAPLPFSEVYLALSQGVVDGQFNPLDAIYENKFHEVQDYLALVNIFYYNTVITMSGKLWDSLDPELQGIVEESALEAKKAGFQYAVDVENRMLEELKPHFKEITRPDTAAFREKTRPVYEDFEKKVGDISDLLTSIEDYRKNH